MRNGIVAVETALMLPVWVALFSLALLIGYGTTIHGSCQNAADLASYAIYHGKSDADAGTSNDGKSAFTECDCVCLSVS